VSAQQEGRKRKDRRREYAHPATIYELAVGAPVAVVVDPIGVSPPLGAGVPLWCRRRRRVEGNGA
jgi:hypothetical protein